jgi:drug/metabolite transporter (DMT)-like permease
VSELEANIEPGLRIGSNHQVRTTLQHFLTTSQLHDPNRSLPPSFSFEPSAGTLLTFVQFLFVAVTGYIAQFDRSRPPFFLTPNKVPLRRWIINIVLFFSINVLNNHAFSYDISVPVHIILRSGGSITTMAAGYVFGSKRYSRTQVVAVLLLTVGVILAAWSDAQTKVRSLLPSLIIPSY